MARATVESLPLLLLLFVLHAPTCHSLLPIHPQPAPRWAISTLHSEIQAHHIHAAAFHQDGASVDVMDSDGEQHRVDIFPGADITIVHDLRDSRVPFFVTPVPDKIIAQERALLAALIHAILLTCLVVVLIDLLGMMDDLLWGAIIVGAAITWTLEALDKGVEATWDDFCQARMRYNQAFAEVVYVLLVYIEWTMLGRSPTAVGQQRTPIPVFVEDDEDERSGF